MVGSPVKTFACSVDTKIVAWNTHLLNMILAFPNETGKKNLKNELFSTRKKYYNYHKRA